MMRSHRQHTLAGLAKQVTDKSLTEPLLVPRSLPARVSQQVRAINDGNEISPTVRVGDIWLTNPRWRQVAASM